MRLTAEHNKLIREAREQATPMSLSNGLPPLTEEQQAKIAAAGGVEGFLKWIDQRAHARRACG
ncbi:MAG: hypothetical protein E5W85_12595 [Mesorhizobium sp.]|nr:MAG: hypothetical protein E5W85_12595 [Mesorhizobium sp.]